MFYEKGWRGINIDPMPSYAEMYKEKRPEDLFVNVGISNTAGDLVLYDCGHGCGLSTFDEKGAQKISAARSDIKFTETKVPVVTMKTILTKYPQTHIAFVNIDVEGWEKQVLESFDFNMVRPEVFVLKVQNQIQKLRQSICGKKSYLRTNMLLP